MSDLGSKDEEGKATFVRPALSIKSKGISASSSTTAQNATGVGRRRKEMNLLQKLMIRETLGSVRNGYDLRSPQVRPFSRLPGRLAFCLEDAVPQYALEAGHVFLGISKCGQFLLSYTQSTADNELMSIFSVHYTYRLHWWLFVPYRRAKKVSEVILFSNSGCPGNLRLLLAYWPNDMSKVLVHGHQILDEVELGSTSPGTPSQSVQCYITVTAVPSLKACKECVRVASTYEEDEMAAAWNSCVRLSCLEHGMTVHTSFDLVRPYPMFEPKITLKRDHYVVINSGNLLHTLDIRLEKLNEDRPRMSQPAVLNFGFLSPPHLSFVQSDSDCESESASASNLYKVKVISNQERLERVAEFTRKISTHSLVTRRIRHLDTTPSTGPDSESGHKRRSMADKAYELTDDDFTEGAMQEKLSTFRRKRLAEKKYEFTDEDSERVIPFQRLRANTSTAATDVTEALCISDVDISGMILPELLSPGGMVKKDHSLASPRSQSSCEGAHSDRPPQFVTKFTRRFIADDETVSVITDIEDDEGVPTTMSYHTALPLEVHGSGYQSMSMISNAKAGRIQGRCVKIVQSTLDMELLCHDMAQKLCHAVGKKYWFCNDYDVEVVDLDPESGDIICVAVVLVMATVLNKTVSHQQNCSISSLQRHQYQAGFKFRWNIDTTDFQVIDSEPLEEIYKKNCSGMWHPAKSISVSLQKSWGVLQPHGFAASIRCFSNDSVILGTSLKTIVDSDHLVAIILHDLE